MGHPYFETWETIACKEQIWERGVLGRKKIIINKKLIFGLSHANCRIIGNIYFCVLNYFKRPNWDMNANTKVYWHWN